MSCYLCGTTLNQDNPSLLSHIEKMHVGHPANIVMLHLRCGECVFRVRKEEVSVMAEHCQLTGHKGEGVILGVSEGLRIEEQAKIRSILDLFQVATKYSKPSDQKTSEAPSTSNSTDSQPPDPNTSTVPLSEPLDIPELSSDSNSNSTAAPSKSLPSQQSLGPVYDKTTSVPVQLSYYGADTLNATDLQNTHLIKITDSNFETLNSEEVGMLLESIGNCRDAASDMHCKAIEWKATQTSDTAGAPMTPGSADFNSNLFECAETSLKDPNNDSLTTHKREFKDEITDDANFPLEGDEEEDRRTDPDYHPQEDMPRLHRPSPSYSEPRKRHRLQDSSQGVRGLNVSLPERFNGGVSFLQTGNKRLILSNPDSATIGSPSNLQTTLSTAEQSGSGRLIKTATNWEEAQEMIIEIFGKKPEKTPNESLWKPVRMRGKLSCVDKWGQKVDLVSEEFLNADTPMKLGTRILTRLWKVETLSVLSVVAYNEGARGGFVRISTSDFKRLLKVILGRFGVEFCAGGTGEKVAQNVLSSMDKFLTELRREVKPLDLAFNYSGVLLYLNGTASRNGEKMSVPQPKVSHKSDKFLTRKGHKRLIGEGLKRNLGNTIDID